jgi:hypothetical protein
MGVFMYSVTFTLGEFELLIIKAGYLEPSFHGNSEYHQIS